MEKITLKFYAHHSLSCMISSGVILTLDDNGKHYSLGYDNLLGELLHDMGKINEDEEALPKRVMKAFTESAIDKILSKDEIPNESGWAVLDGNSYEITITKGDITKEYYADDVTIETYPLLRYLASWYRRHLKL